MPFFFIVPVWAVCVLIGVALMLTKRFRFLSTYFLFGSTVGLLLAFGFSTAILMFLGKILGGSNMAWLALVAYILAIGVGELGGLALGLLFARTLNRRIKWLRYKTAIDQ
jgi:hypothetical protein